ncbi:hypothetical protein Tco_0614990 [Tanacetum coccineum]
MVSCYFLTLLLQDSMPLFYATDEIYPLAWRDVEQYVKMGSCLEYKLPVVLQQTGVFASKGIDPTSYSIKFTNAQNVPKQGGVFGDCGMFVCLFLYRNSYSCDEIVLDVFYNGCFLIYPLKSGGEAVELKLSKVNKLSYKQFCDLLLEKVKQDIWHWFYCKPDCSLEEGLTIMENDRDVKKMYEMANLHGLLEVYVSHSAQLLVTDYYLKNLCVNESYDEVTSQLRSHQKIKKDIDSYSLEEMIAWEQKESQSPCYLISPNPLKPKRLGIDLKEKSLLDDFESIEGEGMGSSSSNFPGETKIANFMKLFFNQHIVEDKLVAKVLRDQAGDLRSRLTKMNQMKSEMEAQEDQDAVFDSLDGLMDTIKRDSDVLVDVTQLQELVFFLTANGILLEKG